MIAVTEDSKRLVAENASKNCRLCRGTGFVSIYHRLYTGNQVITIPNQDRKPTVLAGVIVSHCAEPCEYGQWIRGRVDAALLERIPDLREVLNRRTDYSVDDPTLPAILERVYRASSKVALRYFRMQMTRNTRAIRDDVMAGIAEGRAQINRHFSN